MRPFPLVAGLFLCVAGCDREVAQGPKDPTPIYQAVLQQQLGGAKAGVPIYLSIDAADPSPELMAWALKQNPNVLPHSKFPKEMPKVGEWTGVGLNELKWIDANTAEVSGGVSNGMDGRQRLYRVIRKDGKWVVDSAKTTATS